jgi:hypothetical protein
MKNKNLLIALLLAALLFLVGWVQTTKPQVWEYKETCSVKDLDRLGAEGWELSAATSSGAVTCLFFKRPKQ